MKSKRLNLRLIGQFAVYIMMSRVAFMGIHPVAISAFAIVYAEKRHRNPMILAIMIGVVSIALPMEALLGGGDVIKYILIYICIITIDRLAINRKIYMGNQSLTCLAALVTAIVGVCGGIMNIGESLFLSVGEGILVIVIANLLYKGLHLLEYGKVGQVLSNEQLISFVLVLVLAITGIPNPAPSLISLSEGGLYMLVIFMAYKHGASAGAIAGAGAGIAASIHGQSPAFIGMYCLIGISTGIVKEVGRWASILVFLLSGVAVAMLYPEELWNVEELRAFVAAAIGFIFVPRSLLVSDEDDIYGENILVKHSYQQEASFKLSEFSNAFAKLGETFSKQCNMLPVINAASTGEIFSDLTNTVCGACVNCSYCWEQRYYDTYHETLNMLGSAENNGKIRREDVSVDFAARCIHFDDFMRETNQQLEIARISVGWSNRFAQNRQLVANQMTEISNLIQELEHELSGTSRILLREEEELLGILRAFGVKIRKLAVVEKRDNRLEICMKAKAPSRSCITYKEMSEMISKVMGNRWRIADGKGSVLSKDYEMIVFVPDVKYRVLTGVARTAKEGENVSGDNYSFLRLSNGKVIVTITDGMGSGKLAYDESETVIEMIEQLVEAGFREEMALRLVNSTLIFSQKTDIFSTVDLCVIDLNSGICECIKCGAAATYIRKKNSVRIVSNDTMPIGILPEASPSGTSHRLGDGDLIIMLSDGVTDSFPGEDKEQLIKSIIEESSTDNPQELADYILNRALEINMCKATDDMSVLVAGLWNKY